MYHRLPTTLLALGLLLTSAAAPAQVRSIRPMGDDATADQIVKALSDPASPSRSMGSGEAVPESMLGRDLSVIQVQPSTTPEGVLVQPTGNATPSEVSVALGINFAHDSADLSATAQRTLDEVASALNHPQLAGSPFVVEGHTDASGSADYNQGLSRQRAQAVVNYLAYRGVNPTRLRMAGYGESRLLPGISTTDGRNRRVEVVRALR